jgi:outer membrane protein assembly factor BamB
LSNSVNIALMNPTMLMLLTFAATATLPVAAADWPQFRGPQAGGVDDSTAAPIRWNVESGENIRWRTTLPGMAHASPIIWKDRLYIVTAVQQKAADLKVGLYGDIDSVQDDQPQAWRLLAIEKSSGKILWDKPGLDAVPRVKRHPKASHGNSTPATDGQFLVAIFGSEGLFCFDMEGKEVWRKDLGPMDSGYYAVPSAQWGFASSPVIHDGKVIVLCDVQTNSFIAVYDLRDGKELWRTARKDVPTWGSPTVARAGDQTLVLVNGWHHTGAYDFKTGKEIWRLDGGGDIPVPTPIVSGELAYFTSGHGRFRPMRAIRLDARGDITPADPGVTNAAIVWAHARQGTYMQTPIKVGENVYGCLDNGVVTCFDAKSGTIHFSQRLGSGAEGFTASPVSDGRHLFFPSEIGNVYVLAAGTTFSVPATNKLGETCMASPALQNGILFFRTRQQLLAIGAK